MRANKTPDTELRDLVLKTIAYHKSELSKYEGILNAINGVSTIAKIVANSVKNSSTRPIMPNSFAGQVLSCLKDTPSTSRELHDMYNKATGKNSPFNSFSSQLSTLANKSGRLKKHVFDLNPMEYKYYYGKPEWFDGDDLKQEYLERVKLKLKHLDLSVLTMLL